MEGKRYDLCMPCMLLFKESYTLRQISSGTYNKIICAYCRRRRYGATYELTKKAGKS